MKKKVLFITNNLQYSDGVAKALTELVNALDKEMYDIMVMPLYRCDKEYLREIDACVKIKKVFGFYFRGFNKILASLPQKWIYNLLVKEKFDAEIAFQFGEPTKILAASTNRIAKHVAWIHGYGVGHLKEHEAFDKIVCCSKSNADKYKEEYRYPERVTYLYNLINDEEILLKADEEIEVEKKFNFTFCAVGRLSPEKGFLRLIKCHKRLLDEGVDNNLWIVGGGQEYNTLKKYIADNALEESAILFGASKNPYKYISKSDAFVCSSYSEGFSTVCAEAAILDKPIITTEVGGAKEFVVDNNIGVMAKNSDESLYQAMREFVIHPEKLREYSKNIRGIKDLKYKDRKDKVINFFNGLWR